MTDPSRKFGYQSGVAMAALRMAKQLIVPSALKPCGTIAVTAPSAGVAKALEPRFEVSARFAERAGYVVRRGRCLFSDDHVSASVADRATELQEMLIDETVGAVIPPWGGELLLPVLEHLDFERIRANPRWFAGWSDCSAVTLALLLRSGLMSLHGQNFMDLPMAPAAGGTSWQTILGGTQGDSFTDNAQDAFASKWPDYRADPEVLSFPVDTPTTWKVLGPEREIEATGRLVGGCNEIVSRLAGTPFGGLNSFANTYAPEGLILYLENAESSAFEVARTLHHLRLAGWFERANAVLIGRSSGASTDSFTQEDAVADALGCLAIPVFCNVDIGHVPPQQLIVNGALATVRYSANQKSITQRLA
jgi:muramoyltetrapeptide carboxypeptidase